MDDDDDDDDNDNKAHSTELPLTHLSMVSPRRGGEGGRANHANLIMRSVPRVGILIIFF